MRGLPVAVGQCDQCRVRISAPVSVIRRVCSNWAERLRSLVTTVQSSSHIDRKSTRLNSSHANISYAVFCLKKKKNKKPNTRRAQRHTTQTRRAHRELSR